MPLEPDPLRVNILTLLAEYAAFDAVRVLSNAARISARDAGLEWDACTGPKSAHQRGAIMAHVISSLQSWLKGKAITYQPPTAEPRGLSTIRSPERILADGRARNADLVFLLSAVAQTAGLDLAIVRPLIWSDFFEWKLAYVYPHGPGKPALSDAECSVHPSQCYGKQHRDNVLWAYITALSQGRDHAIEVSLRSITGRVLRGNTFKGTAFAANSRSYSLSCHHVVIPGRGENVRTIAVEYDRHPHQASIQWLLSSEENDVAVLRSRGCRHEFPLLLDATAKAGQQVTSFGYNHEDGGAEAQVYRGHLAEGSQPRSTHFGGGRMQDFLLIEPGDRNWPRGLSGAPLVDDATGFVIGLVARKRMGQAARRVERERTDRKVYAIPTSAVAKSWEGAPIQHHPLPRLQLAP